MKLPTNAVDESKLHRKARIMDWKINGRVFKLNEVDL